MRRVVPARIPPSAWVPLRALGRPGWHVWAAPWAAHPRRDRAGGVTSWLARARQPHTPHRQLPSGPDHR
eukprot:205979-Chlamydomonas_euryale.AAC.3